jgi:hypothetical protein
MTVLRVFWVFFFIVALACLALVAVENGEYIGDKLAVQVERSTTGRQVADPENPEPIQRLFLLWAFRFGVGWAILTITIFVIHRRRVQTISRIVDGGMPSHHHERRWAFFN